MSITRFEVGIVSNDMMSIQTLERLDGCIPGAGLLVT
jgi:hypothetical protein